MAYINQQNPECPNCNKSGLAILPVRYAVVPSTIDTSLPPPLGNKVTNVKLAHHKYVLRTLRQGFVYIYHEKHPRGSHITWEVYSVSTRGTLWKQQSTGAIHPVDDDPVCSLLGHNIPASIISIEKPEKCKKIWIAFSEHAWSEGTFKLLASDAKLRDRRMQTFLPARWISSGGYRHGLPGTQANVEKIIEYQDEFAPSSLVGTMVAGKISKADGSYDPVQLAKETTRHAMAMRKRQSDKVVAAMKVIGTRSYGKHNTPIILALWDAVGITHELNGYRNDAVGRIEQYHHERELEIAAFRHIEGLRAALARRAEKNAREEAEIDILHWTPEKTARRLRDYSNAYPRDSAGYARQTDLCARWERDSTQKVPLGIASQRQRYVDMHQSDWDKKMAEIDRAAARATSAVSANGKTAAEAREDKAIGMERTAAAYAFSKYEKYLIGSSDQPLYREFQSKYYEFMSAVDRLANERTDDLIAWLESKSLIDSLIEFHPDDIDDSRAFDHTVGGALLGVNSSVNGKKKIEAWVKEMKATEYNLVWRAMALNNEKAAEDLNDALQEAENHHGKRTLASTINWIDYGNKSLKAFADTYKKFASLNNANKAATSTAGSKAFGVKLKGVNLRGVDALIMTVGDTVFKHLRIDKLADYASEKIIQHICAVRAFVDPADSIRLIVVQAANETEARGQLVRRFGAAKTFLASGAPAIKTAQSENLTKAWEEFKLKNSGASSALRDSRLALIVMLIEGSNFAKLLTDCAMKGDAKSWWSLAASGMSITSALFDIASIGAKNLIGAESWSYQRIKGAGGVLSAGATAIGVVIDAKEMMKSAGKGQTVIAVMYAFKSVLGSANLALTVATTFTYAAPMIGRITGNVAIGAAARVVGARAAAIIGARILFMSAGSWITVGTFGIQVFIWVFSDNELQDWCALCAFGTRRTAAGAYKTPSEQTKAFENALLEVGLKYE